METTMEETVETAETVETVEIIEAKSQYQHFIPRFVLREFSVPEDEVAASIAAATATATSAAGPSGGGSGGPGGTANKRPKRGNRKKKPGKKKKASGGGNGGGGSSAVDKIAEAMEGVKLEEGEDDKKVEQEVEKGEEKPLLDKGKGKAIDTKDADQGRRRRPRARKEDPRNPLIKFFNLNTGEIEHNRVGRAYGHQDMYRDVTASDANHIEKQLSVLEQIASRAINRIKDSQKMGASSVNLTRTELNTIRKFLFVMKYRNNRFWRKYNCGSMAAYDEVDKAEVQKFMRRRGFKNPGEVWLCTIKAILDTQIDPEGKWKTTVLENAFEHDALWFIFNMTESYLNFCTPDNPEQDEFIVTENGFGIHEGPSMHSVSIDPGTGSKKVQSGTYTEYHKLAPLSPKLLLVLRSNYLRPGSEEALRVIRARPNVPNTPSLFEDLQLAPATASYGSFIGPNEELSDDHVFTFSIQKISRKWVNDFNAIALEEARASISWKSDMAMQRTLRAYLEHPKFPPMAAMMAELKRDAKVRLLTLLGGDTTSVLKPMVLTGDLTEEMAEKLRRKMEKGMPEDMKREMQNNVKLAPYYKLGGTPARLMPDMDRAKTITTQRSASADRSRKGPQYLEARNANSRREMMTLSKLPSTVIFWHVKQWRMNAMVNKYKATGMTLSPEETVTLGMEGPEDWIAELAAVIEEKHRSRLMLEASLKTFFRQIKMESVVMMGMDVEDMTYMMMENELDLFKQWGGISSSCEQIRLPQLLLPSLTDHTRLRRGLSSPPHQPRRSDNGSTAKQEDGS
ncbi:hypothetical protein BZA05DRAFT_410398 [Tricharina praecox]|uniref:uncharacterized protein n=1 Tax=Tricharina praecox TaxID=43433 RepID=UPI00221FA52F|nr:uncharacterized protein BZA05DRAFT_410398 [Tricharina praecox]KAI5843704.1 hypothetical protein BZA05DRAFT_410398 [Tricharina praecox]